jgi:hypothetical protein
MIDDPSKPLGSHKVGYGRPPAQHQFRKGGPSPNPKGRPKKEGRVNVARLLREPITVTLNGEKKAIDPFEAQLQSLAKLAAAGNMASAKEFLLHCQHAGLFEVHEEEDDHQYQLVIPKDWDTKEWHAMYDRHGPPPWPGERDGLVPPERLKGVHVTRSG